MDRIRFYGNGLSVEYESIVKVSFFKEFVSSIDCVSVLFILEVFLADRILKLREFFSGNRVAGLLR